MTLWLGDCKNRAGDEVGAIRLYLGRVANILTSDDSSKMLTEENNLKWREEYKPEKVLDTRQPCTTVKGKYWTNLGYIAHTRLTRAIYQNLPEKKINKQLGSWGFG